MDDLKEIKHLLEKNQQDLKVLKEEVHKVYKQLVWNRVASILKILLIVVPLILGAIYLMPLFSQLLGGYRELLGILNTGPNTSSYDQPAVSNVNSDQSEQFQELINKFQSR